MSAKEALMSSLYKRHGDKIERAGEQVRAMCNQISADLIDEIMRDPITARHVQSVVDKCTREEFVEWFSDQVEGLLLQEVTR